MFLDNCYLLVSIRSELIKTYHYPLTKALKIRNMAVKVCKSFSYTFSIWFLDMFKGCSTVHFQSVKGCHKDCQRRLQTTLTALDIIEFLCTKVSTESCLCNNIVSNRKGSASGYYGVAAMGDICKRTSMNNCGCSLCCLYKVRLYSIEHKRDDSTCNSKVIDRERCIIDSISEEDVSYTPTHVVKIGR